MFWFVLGLCWINIMIKAILFDLDGVLVDACDWHYYALNMSLENNCGIKISRNDHETTFNGIPTLKKLEILEKTGLIHKSDFTKIWEDKQKYTKLSIDKYANFDRQKIDMHKKLIKNGYRLACVTNSIRETATLMLKNTGQIDFLEFIITNEDVKNPKPASECYEKACSLMKVKKIETLIIEDSEKGYKAAIGSGSHVLRVKNPNGVNIDAILGKIKSIEGR